MRTSLLRTAGGEVLVSRLEVTTCMSERLVGLLGRDGLPPGAAMLIAPCSSVHTFGMKFSLDLVFVDNELTVLRTASNVPPGRMAWGGLNAWGVVEAQAGALPLDVLEPGTRLVAEGEPAD